MKNDILLITYEKQNTLEMFYYNFKRKHLLKITFSDW